MAKIKGQMGGKEWDGGATQWDDMSSTWNVTKRGPLGALIRHNITDRAQRGVFTARITTHRPVKNNPAFAQMMLNNTHAVKGWAALSGWKKYRWSLCAFRKGLASKPPLGWSGWSGMSLYFQCRVEQNTPADKQPISPCSARVTDPDASPWNYQP